MGASEGRLGLFRSDGCPRLTADWVVDGARHGNPTGQASLQPVQN